MWLQNFSKFRAFDEFSNVLLSRNPGRENDKERIIAYNIGLGLHDILFACKIYERLNKAQFPFLCKKKKLLNSGYNNGKSNYKFCMGIYTEVW